MGRLPLTRPTGALVLQSADTAPQTSAGWKVGRLLSSPAHCLGLSVPICSGGVLGETFREGLEEALGLPEGAHVEVLLRFLTGCANF